MSDTTFVKVTAICRATRDPELKSNGALVTLGVATNRSTKTDKVDSAGKPVYESVPQYNDLVAFKKTAEYISKYVHKGDLLYLEGTLQDNNYVDREGNKHKGKQIIVSIIKNLSPSKPGQPAQEAPPPDAAPEIAAEDLPF
jgi:single-strand DNA-binding protein